jgi:hypothetical protein
MTQLGRPTDLWDDAHEAHLNFVDLDALSMVAIT